MRCQVFFPATRADHEHSTRLGAMPSFLRHAARDRAFSKQALRRRWLPPAEDYNCGGRVHSAAMQPRSKEWSRRNTSPIAILAHQTALRRTQAILRHERITRIRCDPKRASCPTCGRRGEGRRQRDCSEGHYRTVVAEDSGFRAQTKRTRAPVYGTGMEMTPMACDEPWSCALRSERRMALA
jgi:hypothetical protein